MTDVSSPFMATSWTLVLEAADSQAPGFENALAKICESYWKPLYYQARRMGNSPENAADLVQGFFFKILKENTLKSADRTRGQFRSFLLTSLKRYIINEWQAKQAQKRGGGKTHLCLDFDAAESQFSSEALAGEPTDRSFDYSWAMEIFHHAMETLEKEFEKKGKLDLFQAIRNYLPGGTPKCSQEETAEKLGIPVGTFRSTLSRTNPRLGQILRDMVANTLSHGEDVDAELRYLISVLETSGGTGHE